MDSNTVWLIVGFVGQALFSARFLVQWLASEKQKKSVIPVMFWYFSILGGSTLLVYSIHKEDPVFILGQGAGLLIYARNLYFVVKHAKQEKPAAREV
ncbi:MAG: lipid-A-disaccharide synthase N-terminal domain-containing protein [Methylomonas sp.]|nr:lipid-A-disaccharide synthase N-terminal domain-containing protein [Methylomonas sp.]